MIYNSKLKNFVIHIISSLLFVFMASTTSGQERVVEGIVTTFDSIPVIKVKVEAKSNDAVALTDSSGTFSIKCAPVDKLIFRAEDGFKSFALGHNCRDVAGETGDRC
jgi:hypothetical protein